MKEDMDKGCRVETVRGYKANVTFQISGDRQLRVRNSPTGTAVTMWVCQDPGKRD